MADILTRLLLDTKGFDGNLMKAKQSTEGLASVITGKLGGAVTKVAGGLGFAMGAADAFERIIKGSQTTGDKYAETLEGIKASVDAFFTSLSTGDWSSFFTGMDTVIAKAKEAQRELDQLGNAQMSFDLAQAINQRDIANAMQLAKNKFAPTDVRVGAFNDWKDAIQTQEQQSAQLAEDIQDYIGSAVEAAAGIKGFSANMQNVTEAMLLDIQDKAVRDALKEQYSSEYSTFMDEIKKAKNERARKSRSSNLFERNTAESDYDRAVKKLTEQYNKAITVNAMLVKYEDDQLKALGGYMRNMIQLDSATANLKREYNETANEFNNANKNAKGFTPITAFEGYAVYSGGNSGTGGGGSKKTELKMPVVLSQVSYDTELGGKVLRWMNGEVIPVVKVPIEIEGEDIEELPLPITKESVDNVDDYVNSINALGNVMSALNTQTAEGAAGWLAWAGSLMSASAMAVQSIEKVIAAKSAETVVSAASSAAQTPFVGWLLVGGAVASALAALASIPSFADGGIVPGSNFRDGIAARVSSGEMVINPADQKRLFDSIHSGNMGGGGVSRSIVTGEQIVTAINNYGRRTGKGTILKG